MPGGVPQPGGVGQPSGVVQPGVAPPGQRELPGVNPIIHEWLKKQRLHKYAVLFEGMTIDQVGYSGAGSYFFK